MSVPTRLESRAVAQSEAVTHNCSCRCCTTWRGRAIAAAETSALAHRARRRGKSADRLAVLEWTADSDGCSAVRRVRTATQRSQQPSRAPAVAERQTHNRARWTAKLRSARAPELCGGRQAAQARFKQAAGDRDLKRPEKRGKRLETSTDAPTRCVLAANSAQPREDDADAGIESSPPSRKAALMQWDLW